MQKWESKQRQRAHQSRIQNVKSTFHRQSKSREKQALSSSRSKVSTHVSFKPALPFFRILQIFQLEQYSHLLNFYGFPQKLAYRSPLQDIDEMLTKVQRDDKERFISLLNTLSLMSKSMNKKVKNSNIQPKRQSLLSRSQKSHLPPSSNKTPSTIQKTQKHIGFVGKQTNSKFRIRNKPTPMKESKDRNQTQKKKKSPAMKSGIGGILQTKRTSSMTMDDLNITHSYKKNRKGEPALIEQSNTVVKKLMSKLKVENSHNHRDLQGHSEDIELEMKKIKQMYLSYDSATLTSNITNIDIEEVIDCFSLEIVDLIRKSELILEQRSIVQSKRVEIQKLLQQSFLAVKEQSRSKGSSKGPKEDDGFVEESKIPERLRASSRHSSDAISIEENTMSAESDSSDSFKNMNYYDSFAADFTCFDSRFSQSLYSHKPTKEDVKNFVQLIMMAGRMEKEIPILAHVYLKRLLKNAKGGRLTYSNWRNIVIVVLIEGSKIWDDQSLQNNSFAKVIKPYTTLEINRLEKYLLAFIDYTLTIDQKQYSESYFELRRHAKEATKTANLVKLDLKTIKKLQAGAKKSEGKLKDFYSKCMNKSF